MHCQTVSSIPGFVHERPVTAVIPAPGCDDQDCLLIWQSDAHCPKSEKSHTYENNLLVSPLPLGSKIMKEQRAKYHLYFIE